MKQVMLRTAIASMIGVFTLSANAAVSLTYFTLDYSIPGALTNSDPTGGGNYGGLGSGTLIESFAGSGGVAGATGGVLSGPAAAGSTLSYGVATMSVANVYSQPTGAGNFLHVPDANGSLPASVLYTLNPVTGSTFTKFGFYAGSPDGFTSLQTGGLDQFNSITFYNGTTNVGAYSFLGAPWAGSDSRYLAFDVGTAYTAVSFESNRVAFEVTNFAASGPEITAAVPEPGEWAMMIAGLGVVSVIARRRKKQA
jgi:hypothetical protein